MCLSDAPVDDREEKRAGQTFENNEEFDPGSERTLVECLIHASRARTRQREPSGEWVSNA